MNMQFGRRPWSHRSWTPSRPSKMIAWRYLPFQVGGDAGLFREQRIAEIQEISASLVGSDKFDETTTRGMGGRTPRTPCVRSRGVLSCRNEEAADGGLFPAVRYWSSDGHAIYSWRWHLRLRVNPATRLKVLARVRAASRRIRLHPWRKVGLRVERISNMGALRALG